jgi:hypothetical protein
MDKAPAFDVELLAIAGKQLGSLRCDDRNSRDCIKQNICKEHCLKDYAHVNTDFCRSNVGYSCMESDSNVLYNKDGRNLDRRR